MLNCKLHRYSIVLRLYESFVSLINHIGICVNNYFSLLLLQIRAGSPSAFLYNDALGSPPPAHLGGIPYSLDPSKGKQKKQRNIFSMPTKNINYAFEIRYPLLLKQFSFDWNCLKLGKIFLVKNKQTWPNHATLFVLIQKRLTIGGGLFWLEIGIRKPFFKRLLRGIESVIKRSCKTIGHTQRKREQNNKEDLVIWDFYWPLSRWKDPANPRIKVSPFFNLDRQSIENSFSSHFKSSFWAPKDWKISSTPIPRGGAHLLPSLKILFYPRAIR